MKCLRRIAICLLLGIITTIAAAWAGPTWSGWKFSRINASRQYAAELMADAVGRQALLATPTDNSVLPGMTVHYSLHFDDFGECNGWPLAALTTRRPYSPSEAAPADWSFSWRAGWRLPNPFPSATPGYSPPSIELPVRPLWRGVVIDSALFAAVWWTGLFGVGVVRARTRHRRGLCPRCAYDLKGLAAGSACPECGEMRAGTSAAPRGAGV